MLRTAAVLLASSCITGIVQTSTACDTTVLFNEVGVRRSKRAFLIVDKVTLIIHTVNNQEKVYTWVSIFVMTCGGRVRHTSA
jgi:hypothetical protein